MLFIILLCLFILLTPVLNVACNSDASENSCNNLYIVIPTLSYHKKQNKTFFHLYYGLI